MNEYTKRNKCAICNSTNLTEILNLGSVPLAGNFAKKEELEAIKKYDLKLILCNSCKLVQTDSIIDRDVLFKDYRYISSVGLSGHFNEVANILNNRFNLNGKEVLELGCNDGVLLSPLSKHGAICLGVDPAENIVELARKKGLNVICDYFDMSLAIKYNLENKFDLVVANNTFAHISDIFNFLTSINYVLKSDGYFVFEVHYLKQLLDLLQWDNIYHEHIYYYSITSIYNFMKVMGMTVVDFEEIPIHSGSIRFYVKNCEEKTPEKILDAIQSEVKLYDGIDNFKNLAISHISDIKNAIKELKANGAKIVGYGASGRANMFCNILQLNSDDIDYIIDESPERYGRYIPGANIPIIPPCDMKSDIDYVFILAWNYSKMIIDKLKDYNFKYIIAFPKLVILENGNDITKLAGI